MFKDVQKYRFNDPFTSSFYTLIISCPFLKRRLFDEINFNIFFIEFFDFFIIFIKNNHKRKRNNNFEIIK